MFEYYEILKMSFLSGLLLKSLAIIVVYDRLFHVWEVIHDWEVIVLWSLLKPCTRKAWDTPYSGPNILLQYVMKSLNKFCFRGVII